MSKPVLRMGEKLGVKAFQVGDKVGFYAPGYQKIAWNFDVVSISSDEKVEVVDRDGDHFFYLAFSLDYPSDHSFWSEYQKQLQTYSCQDIELEA